MIHKVKIKNKGLNVIHLTRVSQYYDYSALIVVSTDNLITIRILDFIKSCELS